MFPTLISVKLSFLPNLDYLARWIHTSTNFRLDYSIMCYAGWFVDLPIRLIWTRTRSQPKIHFEPMSEVQAVSSPASGSPGNEPELGELAIWTLFAKAASQTLWATNWLVRCRSLCMFLVCLWDPMSHKLSWIFIFPTHNIIPETTALAFILLLGSIQAL